MTEASEITREVESRLFDLIDGFSDSDATTNEDEGIAGHGIVLRMIYAGRMVEVRVSIEDVTDELSGVDALWLPTSVVVE